jgi:hypothetical protein
VGAVLVGAVLVGTGLVGTGRRDNGWCGPWAFIP